MSDFVPKNTVLNGESASADMLGQVMKALSTPEILEARGGFLFKATLHEDEIWLGIVPCIVNGTRSFHYDMHLEVEHEFTLVGMIDANGVFSILFYPKKTPLADDVRLEYGHVYNRFARVFLDYGYEGAGVLDDCTQQMLELNGIWTPQPRTIFDMVAVGNT